MGLIDQLTSHPQWASLNPQAKGQAVDQMLAQQPGWDTLSPQDQQDLHVMAYSKAGIPKEFHYDPAEAERVEPGATKGLQPSMIQPADLVTFGVAGGAEAAGDAALREGTGLLGRNALQAGLRTGLGSVPAGIGISTASQAAAQPLINQIPATTPLGTLARGTAEEVAGIAPFMTGGEMPNIGTKAMRALRGEEPVIEEAQGAAAKQEAANIAESEKLAGASAKERAAQREATGTAFTSTAEQNLGAAGKAGSKVHEAVTGGKGQPSAQEQWEATKAEADADSARQTQKLHEQSAQEVLPQAKQAAIGQAPSPTMEAGPERIARKQDFVQSIRGPLKAWRQNWGLQRDAALKPVLADKPENLTPMHDSAAEQLKWVATGHRHYSPVVGGLLDWASQVGIPKAPTDEELLQQAGYSPEDIIAISTPAKAAPKDLGQPLPGRERPELANEPPSMPMGQRLIQQLREEWESQPHEEEKPTVAQLLTKQAQANKIAQASHGADRTGAQAVSRAIDDTLAGYSPTDELKALNAQYRDHREHFPYAFEDAIEGAQRPLDAAKVIFDHPERALDLADMGGPETRSSMLQLYAQNVAENGDKVIDPSQAPFLAKLAPGTPFADPKGWVYEKKAEDRLTDVINSSPEVRQRWQAAVDKGTQKIVDDYNKKLTAFAFKDAPRFGPVGERFLTQLRGANGNPAQQQQMIADFYSKLTPEGAAQEAATGAMEGQMPPSVAAYHAQQAAPRTARQAEQAYQPKDPNEAAIEHITQRGYKTTPMRNRMQYRMAWTIPGGIGGLLTHGGMSGYVLGSMGMDAALAVREQFVKSFQESLRDPATARQWYAAITNPGVPRNFQFLADQAAKAGASSALERAGYDMSIPKPQSNQGTEGKGFEGLDHARAEHLAPTPSASDRATKVNKDLSKGKTPDVHKDLNRGRLSMDETNKLLNHASATDPMAMVSGMPLSEMLDSVQVADANERKSLMPLVEQRLRAEMPKIKNKTLQMNLAKRFQMIKSMPAEMEG